MSDFDPFDPDDEAGIVNPRGGIHEAPEILDEEERQEIYLNAVQALTNALGGWEYVADADNGKGATIYRPGDSVLPVLKDLKKMWRKDDHDDERTVARCMYTAGLMKELVALVCEVTMRGEWGRKVALMAFDLIAALTWPIDVAQELKEMEDEGPIVTDYASLLRAQVEYKAIIIGSDTLRNLLSILVPIFAKERRNEKDERIISLGLHIVRNLLAIRDVVAPDSATGEKEELSTLQSQLLVQLDKLTYLELFNTLASQADRMEFNPYNMLVLDCYHLIFRCIKPEQLVKDPERAPVENLTKLLEGEKRQRVITSQHRGSRHSRFGTTVSARANGQKIVLHSQNAINEDVGKALDNNKRKRAARLKRMDELTVDVYFSADALRVTQKFAHEFLADCFNDFIASVLKDIRMERSKVRPADTIRALFVAAYSMEYLILLRKKALPKAEAEALKAIKDGVPAAEIEDASVKVDRELPLGWAIQMAHLDSVRWVVSRMRISMDNKPVAWTELQASIDCFTYILLLIDTMSHSHDKKEREAAETLQDQIYYHGDIVDASLEVVAQYKDQSIAYLESVITFAYVLLKMLERYSKNKKFMFIRKATKRKKNKAQRDRDGVAPVPEEYENDSEDEGVPDDDQPSYAEHAFTFTKFEKKFASEGVCNTLLAYLQRYKELDNDKLRRVVGMIHRQVVKAQAEGLYFQVSSLALFRNILDNKASLPPGDAARDLIQLVTFISRKFFKRLQEDPFLMIEALMPKTRGRWKELSSWQADEDEMGGQRARIREQMGPAKLEFIKKRDLSTSQKIGALVKYFVEKDHEDYINWIITIMEVILAERKEVILTTDGEDALDEDGDGPSEEARKKIQIYYLRPSDPAHIDITKSDSHFRLLLEVLGFWNTESEPSDADSIWVYPPSELPSVIEPLLESLKENLAFPPTDLGDIKTLVRRVYKRRAVSDDETDAEDEGDGIERPKRKRRRNSGDPPVRRQKAQEVQTYKSAAFIWDSDDDEEADAAFFAREAQLRAEMVQRGQAAEEEVRAIMEGKTLRKPKRVDDDDVDMEEEEEDEETKQEKAEWKALRRSIMQEWYEHYDDDWRPHQHLEWRGPYDDKDDEEFLLRKAGNWDSETEGPIKPLDSDSDSDSESEDEQSGRGRSESAAVPARRRRAVSDPDAASDAASDAGSDADVEDKENQPPASAAAAASTPESDGDKENRPPKRAKIVDDEMMDEDQPVKDVLGDIESTAPVVRRRRLVESDDED